MYRSMDKSPLRNVYMYIKWSLLAKAAFIMDPSYEQWLKPMQWVKPKVVLVNQKLKYLLVHPFLALI